MSTIQRVVGVAFIEDGRLLIVQSHKSKKTNSWTFVGGGIEEHETEIKAAMREVTEEIRQGFTIAEEDLIPILKFKEKAASDPNKMIEMNIFLCSKKIDVPLKSNNEILSYHWFKYDEKEYFVSSSIKDHFVPYAIEKGIMY